MRGARHVRGSREFVVEARVDNPPFGAYLVPRAMSSKRDYYEVLGVSKGAPEDEIKKAYKREAVKHHPDRNPGDESSAVRFKECTEAYQVLCDEQKRAVYDRFGHEGLEGGMGGGFGGGADVFGHMQDLFNEMFSGFGGGGGRSQRGGQDVRIGQRITLREAAFGCKREVSLRTPAPCGGCKGSGAAEDGKVETCSNCRGSGQVSTSRGFVMFSQPCGRCQGRGKTVSKPCKECKGQGMVEETRKVTVAVPAGIDNGQRLRVSGQGVAAPNGQAGDLYVDIEVSEDPTFERDGTDLVARLSVPYTTAVMGGVVNVPVLRADDEDAKREIKLDAGTQPGDVLRLRGEGITRVDGRGKGELLVVVQIEVPKKVSRRAKELLEELAAEYAKASAS